MSEARASRPALSVLHDADALIVRVDGEFRLLVGTEFVRSGSSGRELSQFAFANGAQSVRWDFDLTLEPATVTRVRGTDR